VKPSTRWLSPCEGPLPKRWPNYCSSWPPDITQLPNGSRHDPHVLLIEPTVPETDAAYCAPPACGTRPRGTDRFNRLLGARHVTAAGTAPEVREKTQRRRQPRWLVGGNLERVRR